MELTEALDRLKAAGIQPDAIKAFQIVCFPENVFASPRQGELFEAADALTLLKRLKEAGVKSAGSLDFGLDIGVLSRHSGDRWLGVVWIRDIVAVPLLIGIIGSLIANQIDRSISNEGKPPLAPAPKVHVELYVEKENQLKHLLFDGDGETLLKLLEAMKEQ
jgi:hypothetical protein